MAIERGENKVNNIKYLKTREIKRKLRIEVERKKNLVKQKAFIEEIRKNYYTYSIIIFLTFSLSPSRSTNLATFHISFREMNEMKQVIVWRKK